MYPRDHRPRSPPPPPPPSPSTSLPPPGILWPTLVTQNTNVAYNIRYTPNARYAPPQVLRAHRHGRPQLGFPAAPHRGRRQANVAIPRCQRDAAHGVGAAARGGDLRQRQVVTRRGRLRRAGLMCGWCSGANRSTDVYVHPQLNKLKRAANGAAVLKGMAASRCEALMCDDALADALADVSKKLLYCCHLLRTCLAYSTVQLFGCTAVSATDCIRGARGGGAAVVCREPRRKIRLYCRAHVTYRTNNITYVTYA